MPYSGSGVFAVYTPGTPYVTGTIISSTVANNVNSDFATGLSTAITKDGQTTTTAAINFALGIKLGGGAALTTSDSTTSASTFTFDGSGGTSGSITMTLLRIGNYVVLNLPATLATSGTSSTLLLSNSAIPAAYRPTTDQFQACNVMQNNGAAVSSAGTIRIKSTGLIQIQRDAALSVFSNAVSCGTAGPATVVYFVG